MRFNILTDFPFTMFVLLLENTLCALPLIIYPSSQLSSSLYRVYSFSSSLVFAAPSTSDVCPCSSSLVLLHRCRQPRFVLAPSFLPSLRRYFIKLSPRSSRRVGPNFFSLVASYFVKKVVTASLA